MDDNALDIVDQRTKTSYNINLSKDTLRAMDLRQIKKDPEDFGLMTYDPAFLNTASCQSAITFIDGDKGILRYRGYPIEQLAGSAPFWRLPISSYSASCLPSLNSKTGSRTLLITL